MSRRKKLTAKHCAGGLNLGTGQFSLKPEENIESRNMEYTIEGAAVTSLGYDDPGWSWGEDNKGMDGLHRVYQYPDLIFGAVNGKIKYVNAATAPQSSASVYEADTGLALTAGNPVFMRDYRGMLYFCNGVENLGRIAIGQLFSSLTNPAGTYSQAYSDSGTTYSWTASGSGTNEYYVRLTAGSANPRIGTPTAVTLNSIAAPLGTLGALAAGEYGYGDNDTLGYSTVYVRLADGADPDSKGAGWVNVTQRAVFLNPAEGYRFSNATDKVYVEGDEVDYVGEIDGTSADKLVGATNVAATHAIDSYVTQYNTVTAPSSGSIKAKTLQVWRDTMWIAGMADEPGVLRYSKTIGTVSQISNLHDFSDGNNYIIGDGGEITALQATEDRLYVFMKDKVHYIGTEYNSSAVQTFARSKLFTGVYGCPNAFCVTTMEDVVIFFTGKRLIRIGYDPNGQTLIPDEKFDREILTWLQDADEDQTNARLVYNPYSKELRLKFIVNGVAKTIKYHKQLDKYSGPSDEDANCYIVHRNNTYFGEPGNDIVHKIGKSIDSAGDNTQHRLAFGRNNGGNDNWKLYIQGMVKGKKNIGSTLYLLTKIDDKNFGAARAITDTVLDQSASGTPLGEAVIGSDEIGLSGETTTLFPFVYRFLLGKRGKDYSYSLSSDESGALWQLEGSEFEWEEFDNEPRTHY